MSESINNRAYSSSQLRQRWQTSTWVGRTLVVVVVAQLVVLMCLLGRVLWHWLCQAEDVEPEADEAQTSVTEGKSPSPVLNSLRRCHLMEPRSQLWG